MTRPSKNLLVLDGNEVKYRLLADRKETGSVVHVDWLRFTCFLRNSYTPPVEVLFPHPVIDAWDAHCRRVALRDALNAMPSEHFAAASQAWTLAQAVAKAMGEGFAASDDIQKGHDFYKHRFAITRNSVECGWVGFLASGDSPRQQAQSATLHVNLFGAACTFAELGWRDRMANLIEDNAGDITRCDLALDFFEGIEGGLTRVQEDYMAGLMDVGGKRLKCNMVGDWCNMQSRSFYFGSKEAGKQTNVYEKGDQLFGVEEGSTWERIELRYGNKLRVLPTDMLRRPSDFFGGASDWHLLMLSKAAEAVRPQSIPRDVRLPLETVSAEVARSVRWSLNTAAANVAVAFEFMGEAFLELVTNQKLPGRLRKFPKAEIAEAFEHHFKVESSPAFAIA